MYCSIYFPEWIFKHPRESPRDYSDLPVPGFQVSKNGRDLGSYTYHIYSRAMINTWSARFHSARPAWLTRLSITHHSLRTPAAPRSIRRVTTLSPWVTRRWAAVTTRFRRRRQRRSHITCSIQFRLKLIRFSISFIFCLYVIITNTKAENSGRC